MGTKTQRQISTGTLGIWHIPCSFSVGGRHLKLEQAMNVNFLFVLFFFQQPFIMCCLYTRTRARYWNLKDVLGLFRGFFEVKVIKLIIWKCAVRRQLQSAWAAIIKYCGEGAVHSGGVAHSAGGQQSGITVPSNSAPARALFSACRRLPCCGALTWPFLVMCQGNRQRCLFLFLQGREPHHEGPTLTTCLTPTYKGPFSKYHHVWGARASTYKLGAENTCPVHYSGI